MEALLEALVSYPSFLPDWLLLRLPTFLIYFIFSLILLWFFYGIKNNKLKVKSREIIILSLIFSLALLIRIIPPFMVGAGGGEEYRYATAGQEMSETGRFLKHYLIGSPVLYPRPYITYSALVAIPCLFSGATRTVAIYVNRLLGSFMIFGAYFLMKEFTSKQNLAILASVLISILPVSIYMSNTPESVVTAALFFMLFFKAFLKYLENDEFYWGLGATLLFVPTLTSRISSFVFIPPLFFSFFLYKRKNILESKNIFYMILAALLSFFPFLMFLRYKVVRVEKSVLTLKYFFRSLDVLNGLIFERSFFYFFIFVFGMIGLLYAFRKFGFKKSLVFVLPLIANFMLHASDESFIIKYFHFTFTYLALLASIPLYEFYVFMKAKIGENFSQEIGKILKGILIVLYLFLILFLGFKGLNRVLSRPPDREYPSAVHMVKKGKEMYPGCVILPAFDVRPIRLAGFRAINPWVHKGQLGNLSWYRSNLNTSCLIYYKVEPNKTRDYMEEFEKKIEKELIYTKEFQEGPQAIYLINLTEKKWEN